MTARPGRAALSTAIVLTAALAAVVVYDCAAGAEPPAASPKSALQLRGGVILVYKVKPSAPESSVDMDRLVAVLRRRVQSRNVRDLTIRPDGDDKIEIIVPNSKPTKQGDADAESGQEELDLIKKLIETSGAMEFRILAGAHRYQPLHDLATLQQREEERTGKAWADDVRGRDSDKAVARWVTILQDVAEGIVGNTDLKTRKKKVDDKRIEEQVLVVLDRNNVTGGLLVDAQDGLDFHGRPCVLFRFGEAGAVRFFNLTSAHLPTPDGNLSCLGIILDGVLQSAPQLREAISSSGQITGGFTVEETKSLAEILTAGALPAVIVRPPLRETVVGATLGAETTKPSPVK
jgi:preprotein translocase subunit SecD